MRIINPEVDQRFFTHVNLMNWRGDKQGAADILQARLNHAGGDAWAILALSEIECSRGNYQKALNLTKKASAFLQSQDQLFVKQNQAYTALEQEDWHLASKLVNGFNAEEKVRSKNLLEQYELRRSARFIANFNIQHQTPNAKQSDEITQDYMLYSAKTEMGHSAYVHYLITQSPTNEDKMRQQRAGVGVGVGVGVALNFYPLMLNIEAGKGIQLNNKAYYSANLSYEINDNWQFGLNGNINGSSFPVKGIKNGIYTKDFGVFVTYSYNDRFLLGININQMNFDDGNRRKSLTTWAGAEVFKHDRWKLTANFRWDIQHNHLIADADDYNPERSRNLELTTNLSYYQPLNYGVAFTHHLKTGVGRFAQTEHSSQNSWSVAYGHEWRLGKRISVSYQLGRKKIFMMAKLNLITSQISVSQYYFRTYDVF
ncbi:poly-beta-1,6 N-acetyl-D-glucosamine export porin PgaA [Avibacterium endocarditidis]